MEVRRSDKVGQYSVQYCPEGNCDKGQREEDMNNEFTSKPEYTRRLNGNSDSRKLVLATDSRSPAKLEGRRGHMDTRIAMYT